MSPLIAVLLWSFVLTILACILEITYRAKCGIKALLNFHSFLFLGIQIVGNVLASIAAYYLIHTKTPLPEDFGWFEPFIAGVFGVFMFEFVFSNTNISMFDTGILKFQDWVELGRVPAITKSSEREAEYEMDAKVRLTNDLFRVCPLHELDIHLQKAVSAAKWKTLSTKDQIYKCRTLVDVNKHAAKALVKDHEPSGKKLPTLIGGDD